MAGFFHDVAKLLDPEINQLVNNGRTLTDDEWQIVNSHAARGGAWAMDNLTALESALLPGVVHDITNHHTDTPDSKVNSGFVHALQTADQTDAMLLDWTRTYKIARFTKEGLLDENHQPNLGAIVATIMRGKPERFFGIPTRRIVEIGVSLMPAFMAEAGVGPTQQ